MEFNWLDNQIRIGDIWKDPQIAIQGGQPLTRACFLESLDLATSDSDYKLDAVKRSAAPENLSENLKPDLTPIQENSLQTHLLEYSDVFAVNPKSPTAAKGILPIINTGNAQPIKQKIHPVAPLVEEEIMRQVSQMLSNQICRKLDSPWASRVLLVTKRDGSRRFCVDYRELNKVTRADSYPMPHPKAGNERFTNELILFELNAGLLRDSR